MAGVGTYNSTVPELPKNVTRIQTLKGTVDSTGESVSVQQFRRGKKKGRRKTVSMVNVDTMMGLELTGQEYRVLWCLLSHVPERSGTTAYCQITQIADETGIHRVDVSKVMRDLRDRNIVRTLRQGQHHVNSHIAYSGSFDEWSAEDEHEEPPLRHRHSVDPKTGEVR